jgi:hypothetical protein
MICRSFRRFERPSRSMGVNQPDDSSERVRIDVAPCVTAVEKLDPFSTALYCPV